MSIALITGCSSGFGLETALAFARAGHVTYASMRNPQRGTTLLERAWPDDFTAGPYGADYAWVRTFIGATVMDQGADPSIVARAVVRAAEDPSTPLHMVIGEGAEGYLELATRAGGYEGWAAAVTQVFETVAGPRPEPLNTQTSRGG